MSVRKMSNPEEFEDLWTIEEIATYYKVCIKTIRLRIVDLDVPIVYIGRQIRVRASHVPLLAKKKW